MRRRGFLQAGTLCWSPFLFSGVAVGGSVPRVARAKACLVLYMDGGPSHIDMLDMKPHAPAEIRGPFQPVSSSVAGISVCEHLPKLAQQMQHVAQIRSVRHRQTVHDPAVYQMLTGYKHVSSAGGLQVEETDLPHMGSAFHRADRTRVVMPRFIEIPDRMKMQDRVLPGQNAGILGASWDPFQVHVTHGGEVVPPPFDRIAEMSDGRLNRRKSLFQNLQRSAAVDSSAAERFELYQRQALEIVARPSIQSAFDVERESAGIRAAYGRHRHGTSVLLARRLIEAGSRFVTVYWGKEEQDWADGKPPRLANNPWDTHRNHFPLSRDHLIPRTDQTFAALLADMHERGLLEETLVVWMGDFGRTPRINRRWASRDHWPHAFTVMLAGAGVQGGMVYGETDRYAEMVTADPVSPADLTATIFAALGIDPGLEVSAGDGLPHRISTGKPVSAIFGGGAV